ncbi:hypothetical protein CP061683_1247B, partial [Chlamydia psittaci 06-1683]
SSPDTT